MAPKEDLVGLTSAPREDRFLGPLALARYLWEVAYRTCFKPFALAEFQIVFYYEFERLVGVRDGRGGKALARCVAKARF